jgi:hypothetical protein
MFFVYVKSQGSVQDSTKSTKVQLNKIPICQFLINQSMVFNRCYSPESYCTPPPHLHFVLFMNFYPNARERIWCFMAI